MAALALARRVWRDFSQDDCGFMAAAVAYQMFFALLPFLLLLAGVLSLFLTSQQLRQEVVVLLRDVFPGAVDRRLVDEIVASGGLSLGIGLVGTIWGVTAIHASLDRALRAVIQGGSRHFIRSRLEGLAFAILLSILAVLSFALSFVVQAAAGWLRSAGVATTPREALLIVSPIAGLLAGFVLFYVIYRIVPRRRMPRMAVVVGALVAAVLWEVAKIAFALLAREAGVFKGYGVLALAAALLTWIYLTALILLLGAEVMKAWSERTA